MSQPMDFWRTYTIISLNTGKHMSSSDFKFYFKIVILGGSVLWTLSSQRGLVN